MGGLEKFGKFNKRGGGDAYSVLETVKVVDVSLKKTIESHWKVWCKTKCNMLETKLVGHPNPECESWWDTQILNEKKVMEMRI